MKARTILIISIDLLKRIQKSGRGVSLVRVFNVGRSHCECLTKTHLARSIKKKTPTLCQGFY